MLQTKNRVSQAYGAMQVDESALVREHQGLVTKIAWQIKSFSPDRVEIEDLIQVGLVTLVEASAKYIDQGHSFTTYLYVRVRGAMIDYLRTTCNLRRSAVEWNKKLRRVSEQLAQENGYEPNEVDLANAMGIDQAEFRKNADRAIDVHVDSLDEVYCDSSSWFTNEDDDQHETLEKDQMVQLLSANLKKLNEREQLVLNCYFIEEMQLDEIGAALDVSSVRVCQIKKRALEKLQAAMGSGK
ncbi:sigma-70 family RNA polymerase sigma factor [Parasphingorhabdus sp. JC815]|uniref:sigma-70 family RNA polymerase sigma factor n=1 Tax=Parasphingorhabdus sp. JC815 TaxID=3232140 RepID=UPI003458928B